VRATLAGVSDAFCTVVNPTGTAWRYSTYLGSTGTDCANGVAFQPNGHVVTDGATDNAGFPATAESYDPSQNSAGINDIFVSSLDAGVGGTTAVGDGPPSVMSAIRVGPNPFRSSAAIRFALVRPARLAVSVVDVQGRVVRRLAEGAMEPGAHELAWDGRDDRGNDAGTGVFFVQAIGEARSVGSSTIVRLR
jgi:hypothetical protein